jgi:hypothetical protein
MLAVPIKSLKPKGLRPAPVSSIFELLRGSRLGDIKRAHRRFQIGFHFLRPLGGTPSTRGRIAHPSGRIF